MIESKIKKKHENPVLSLRVTVPTSSNSDSSKVTHLNSPLSCTLVISSRFSSSSSLSQSLVYPDFDSARQRLSIARAKGLTYRQVLATASAAGATEEDALSARMSPSPSSRPRPLTRADTPSSNTFGTYEESHTTGARSSFSSASSTLRPHRSPPAQRPGGLHCTVRSAVTAPSGRSRTRPEFATVCASRLVSAAATWLSAALRGPREERRAGVPCSPPPEPPLSPAEALGRRRWRRTATRAGREERNVYANTRGPTLPRHVY